MTSTASSMNFWCSYRILGSSRSCWLPMETARLRRSSQVPEEEGKIRTRRMPGRHPLQLPTQRLSWTVRCAPLADRYWPPKTSTLTRLCTSGTARNSLPCSQSVASSASPQPISHFSSALFAIVGPSGISPAAASVGKQQPVSCSTMSQRSFRLVSRNEGKWFMVRIILIGLCEWFLQFRKEDAPS